MKLFILIFLIFLNGFFAMTEIAMVTARKGRLSSLAAGGDAAARSVLELARQPTRLFSTIQIGSTSIGLLSGIFGEAVLTGPLVHALANLGFSVTTTRLAAAVSVVAIITYVSIVVGELVPKRLGQLNPERVARWVARPMQVITFVTLPFGALLTASARGLLRLLGVRADTRPTVTEEEIRALIDEGSRSGTIERQQHVMLRNIFRLDDRRLASIMVPRSEIAFLDLRRSAGENLRRLLASDFTRLPVCEGGLDRILGVIPAKQALLVLAGDGPDALKEHLIPPVFVPETLTGLELLEHFRVNLVHFVFVVDEYGNLEGMATLHNVLEALTGQVATLHETSWAEKREDGSWLLDGSIPIPEMKDRLNLQSAPREEKGYYNILGGMLMLLLGRVPRTGDTAEWGSWRFEIVDMDGNGVGKVLARPSGAPTPPRKEGAPPASRPGGEAPKGTDLPDAGEPDA